MKSRKRFFANKKPSYFTTTQQDTPKKTGWKPKKKETTAKKGFVFKRPNKRKYTNKFGVTRIGRAKYSYKWPELSAAVKKERGYRCERCDSTDRLEVHHIIPISRGGRDVRSNLIVLCHKCHSSRHKHLHGRQ